MATNRVTVIIDAVADRATTTMQGFKRSVAEADGAVGKLKAGTRSLTTSLRANAMPAAAAAGAAMFQFGRVSVDAASRLSESTNAVRVVFKDAAEDVLAIGENSAESMGLSKAAFNEAAVSFAGFSDKIKSEGLPAAEVIGTLTQRAADFASVHNIEVADAVQVFQSTLAGETEAIRRYGGDVSAAAVELYAMENGLADSSAEMTEAIKVQARYGLLLEQTADTAGDFEATAGSLANQQRRAKAAMEDLAAEAGNKLIPALEGVAGAALTAVEAMEKLNAEVAPGGVKLFDDMFSVFGKLGGEVSRAWDDAFGDDPNDAIETTAGSLSYWTDITNTAQTRLQLYGRRARWAANQTRSFGKAISFSTDQINDSLEATQELIESRNELAGKTLDAREAEIAWWESLEDLNETLEDAESNERDVEAARIDSLRATEDMVKAQLEADGVIVESERGQKAYTTAMLATAAALGGPMQREIMAHVARVNGIPEEKITEIEALLDQNQVAAARALLDSELSKAEANPDVRIESAVLQAQRERLERILGRTISIPVNTYTPTRTNNSGGGNTFSHTGSLIPAGRTVGVTSAQAALFTPDQATRMPSNEEARRMLDGGGVQPPPVNIYVQGVTPDDVAAVVQQELRRWVR